MIRASQAMLFLGIFSLLLTLSGCTTLNEMSTSQSSGDAHVEIYAAPYAVVFDAAKEACRSEGLEIELEDMENHQLICTHGASITSVGDVGLVSWSYGEKIGIYFKKIDPGTSVRILSKADNKLTMVPRDFTYALHARMYSVLIAKEENQGRFCLGGPFWEEGAGHAAPLWVIKKDEFEKKNLALEEQEILLSGTSSFVGDYNWGALSGIRGEKKYFKYDEHPEVYWFAVFSSKFFFMGGRKSPYQVKWGTPDGSIHKESRVKFVEGQERVLKDVIKLSDLDASLAKGMWTVELSKDGQLIATDKFWVN